jgi:hypothetical protein
VAQRDDSVYLTVKTKKMLLEHCRRGPLPMGPDCPILLGYLREMVAEGKLTEGRDATHTPVFEVRNA